MFLQSVLVYCLVAVCYARTVERPHLGFRLPLDGASGRIAGGSDAKKGEFPHQISLQWGNPPYLRHLCGGSILNSRWILTAAHCPKAVPNSTLYVKAGKHLIKSIEKTEQTLKVEKVFIHKKYPNGVSPYDISLLKLEKPLLFNNYVQPIKLPVVNSTVDGEVVLSGWGSTSTTQVPSMPDTLQKAKLPIVDLETCGDALRALIGTSEPLHETNICTGPLTGSVSACSGDSGGPLIKVLEDETVEVVGIVSWGIIPCGTTGAPSIYTKVSSYNDWIDTVITNH